MKRFHYMLLLLALIVCQKTIAQFNPEPPDEPGARPWLLTLKAVPAEAGYFNLNQQSSHVSDEAIQLTAYTNSGYRFVCWEDSLGNALTTERSWNYTMPSENVTLTARYEYSPGTPDEPGQASIKKRLFIKANPADAGRFNLNSTNDIVVGQIVHVQAYGNQNYTFRNWTEDGSIISSAAAFTYTMPDKDVTLTANFDFDYQPGPPNEPGQPQLETCIVYAMREDVVAGQTCMFPVYFENNGSDVTGFSVDISFPQGFSTNANGVELTGSVANHSLNVSQLDANTWHFNVGGNSVIEKGDGRALLIPLSVSQTAAVGGVYAVELKNGMMIKADGGQTNVKVRSGSLRIVQEEEEKADRPDYVVTDLQTTAGNVAPGDEIQVTWKVKNQGKRVGPARWSERIYLMSASGRKVSIGTTSYNSGQLQPGETISRSATLALGKMPGIDGKLNIVVTIIPSTSAGETTEDQQNNTTETTGAPINLSKFLYLTLPETPQTEGSVKTIRCQLARSGDWKSSETFTVKTINGDSRVSVPDAIFIPRDQAATYFYLPLANNDKYDINTIVSFSVEGNGYSPVTGQLVIEDDELPTLSLTASKSVVAEGEPFRLTVTASEAVGEPLALSFYCEHPGRFSYPLQATIPAGQQTATVDVLAIDDDLPGEPLSSAFIVSAPGYEQQQVIVILNDDDMPVLELQLLPGKVQEGAGPASVAGILRRTVATASKVTVVLGDDSRGGLYLGPRQIELAEGVGEASFNFGPVDNALADGDRTYTVTAAVWLSSCSCSASAASAGSVAAQLQVLDDDGPALSLTSAPSTIKEGGRVVLTVGRNTLVSIDQPLTVRLGSDDDASLSYEHRVTIPAGQQTAQVEIVSTANDVSGDTRTIVFTAEAEGYSSGTCYLMMTDQTLPDARVAALALPAAEAEALSAVQVSVAVANGGIAPLPAHTAVTLHLLGSDQPLATLYTEEAVPAGETTTVRADVALPNLTGQVYVYAVVNEGRGVEELYYNNNTSEFVQLRLLSNFTTEVAVDRRQCVAGDAVAITGRAKGSAAANVAVEVYVSDGEVRQTLETVTDQDGAFAVKWTPLEGQAGRFAIGACHPGENLGAAQTTVDVVGLKMLPERRITCETMLGEPYTGTIELYNPGFVEQTLKSIEVTDKPEGCSLTFGDTGLIAAGGIRKTSFTLTCSRPTAMGTIEKVRLRASTNEGARIDFTIVYSCLQRAARLATNIDSVVTTVAMGTVRDYQFTISNTGKGDSGPISVALPDVGWLSMASSLQMRSLGSGQSATAVLRMAPTNDLQLNVPQTGTIGLNCENGQGVVLPYKVTPVSGNQGTLLVDVIDEYTFTEGSPHVQGATVVISQPITGVVVAQGVTDGDGHFTTTLAEGYYAMEVTADRHYGYKNHLQVSPCKVNTERVFLQYQAISVKWDVVETGIDDEYGIVTTLEYETNVPLPVVEVVFPERLEYRNQIFNIVLTNKGLLKAIDLDYCFPDVEGVTFEVLNPVDELAAQSTATVSVRMTVDEQLWWGHPVGNIVETQKPCVPLSMEVDYSYVCKDANSTYLCSVTITHSWLEDDCQGSRTTGYDVISGGSSIDGGGGASGSTWNGASGGLTTVYRQSHCADTDPEKVCAIITLQLSQQACLTRQAFRGTLTVYNGHDTKAMTDVRLILDVKDEAGRVATSREFQINVEDIGKFAGGMGLTDGWRLDARQTGVATILFIPTKYAAAEKEVVYSFGGLLSYTDPFTGKEVRRTLSPVRLTVSPSPGLQLTYLMQRDVYGDDPLTDGVVEPMEPAEFALIIDNQGNGDAHDLRMQTDMPKITVNEAGLLIDFALVSSQVNGEAATLSLGPTFANDFGTIAAHQQSYAQWWLQSSLTGHFTSYEVEARHLTSYGNRDLSLVDTVAIHEMVRGFTPVYSSEFTGQSLRGWLVNDMADGGDMPDAVYFSDATQQPLYMATGSVSKNSETEYELSVSPGQPGWNYGIVADPTGGHRKLARIFRKSDGMELPLDNVWQTDRTLRDNSVWLYENRLHFVGEMSGRETLVLTFGEGQHQPEEEHRYELSIGRSGYATFYDSEWSYQLPAELTASVVSAVGDRKLTYTRLEDDVVPKGIPVILESSPHKAGVYTLTGTDNGKAYDGTNLLHGSDEATTVVLNSGERAYKLAYGPSGTRWSDVFGWYWGAENGGAFQIEGHKAWLVVPAAAGARAFSVDGDALDISAALNDNGEMMNDEVYDLQGRKIENGRLKIENSERSQSSMFNVQSSMLRKGVYIRNGQKVVVK